MYGVSGVLARLVGFLLIPLYTRVFVPGEYGIVALIDVLIGLVGILAILGLDNASARWYYDSDDAVDRRATISSWFWCQLVLSTFLAAVLLTFAPAVSAVVCGSPDWANLVRLAALALPLTTTARVLGNWFRYRRRAWAALTFTITRMLGTIGFILLFVVVWRKGLTGLYTARLVAACLAAAAAVVILRQSVGAGAYSWDRLKSMLRYGLPFVLASGGIWIMASADRFILNVFCDKAEIGLYAIAAAVAAGVGLVSDAFKQAWGPFAYSILKEKEAGRVYARVLDLYSFLGCMLCTAVAVFAPLLLRLLTTEAYYPAASCVACLAFAFLLHGARFIASLGSGIAKKALPAATSVCIGATVNVGLNFLLIPLYGRQGAAVATLLGYCASVVYLFAASQRHYRIPYNWHVSLVCFAFSWIVIGTDHWLVPGETLVGFVIRVVLVLLFVPLGVFLGLVRTRHLRQLLAREDFAT